MGWGPKSRGQSKCWTLCISTSQGQPKCCAPCISQTRQGESAVLFAFPNHENNRGDPRPRGQPKCCTLCICQTTPRRKFCTRCISPIAKTIGGTLGRVGSQKCCTLCISSKTRQGENVVLFAFPHHENNMGGPSAAWAAKAPYS